MNITPNSWGSDEAVRRPRRPLREFNKCHNPKGEDGGKFCSTPGSGEGASPHEQPGAGHLPGQKPPGSIPRELAPHEQPGAGKQPPRPVPHKVRTVEEGVEAILAGKVVEVEDVRTVNTILHKLGEMALDAESKGENAPDYDLCKISVTGTNLFCVDRIRTEEHPEGIDRLHMPQLGGQAVPGSEADSLPKNKKGEVDGAAHFIKELESLGISVSQVHRVASAELKATQMNMVGANVAGMMKALPSKFDPSKDPIFVTRDGYVLDGHHRWAAVVGHDTADGKLGNSGMNVRVIDAPISEILPLANTWSKRFGIAAKAAGKKGQIKKAKEARYYFDPDSGPDPWGSSLRIRR